jgi:HEAT repeat protein
VKWKLSTIAVLATMAGTCALTPPRATAQQLPPAPASSPPPDPATLPSSQPAPYDALAILTGTAPDITQAQRDEAAQRLLSRQTAEARKTLHDALVNPDRAGQLAAARALDEEANPDPSFIDPLFPLLEYSPDLATAAGRALAGYKSNATVLTRLIDYATARHKYLEFTHQAAIHAIGAFSEKRAADALRQLLESPDVSASIHKAAAAALTSLTGLVQNGDDAALWEKWWESVRNTPDAQFRTDIDAIRVAQLDRQEAHFNPLIDAYDRLLTDEYHRSKSQTERQDLMMTFLSSPEPEIRKLGARLLSADVVGGNRYSDAELKRLREMIADSDPGVRGAVVDAISKINDVNALDELLNQLKVEPDSSVRAAIAKALGPIQNLNAVDTLINLLSDDALPTAEAAAQALGELAQGPLPSKPNLARKTALALKATILAKSNTAGTGDLRADCIEALAALQQPDIIQDLLAHKLMDPGKEESFRVRKAMLLAVGKLNDPNAASLIATGLGDPDADVQRQAIMSLETNPGAAGYADIVGKLLGPESSPDESVREEAWKFLEGVFPRLNESQLRQWPDRLRDLHQPEWQLLALEALAEKQTDAKQQEDLAVTQTEIGDVHRALKHYGAAAASYGAALQNYDSLPQKGGAQATIQQLVKAYELVRLDDQKYSDAVQLAKDRIGRDPSEQSNLVPIIVYKAEELMRSPNPKDLLGAQQLIQLAQKIPNLDPNYQGRLSDAAAEIHKRMSNTPAQ